MKLNKVTRHTVGGTAARWIYPMFSAALSVAAFLVLAMSDDERISAIPDLDQSHALRARAGFVIGVSPRGLLALQELVIGSKGYFTPRYENGAIVGAAIASQFELEPGKQFKVHDQMFVVIGVLRQTRSKDDLSIFVPIAAAQAMYGVQDQLPFISVRGIDLERLEVMGVEI